MDIRRTEASDLVSLALTGRLDAGTAPEAEQAVRQFLASDKAKLLLDLSGLDYISSAGLRVLLIASKGVKQKPGRFALCGLKGNVKEILDVSGLTPVFSIAGTADEAARLLGSGAK